MVIAGETVVVAALLPFVQEYVIAPDAVRVVDSPEHITGEFTAKTGSGVTVIVEAVVVEQPFDVPVTVYVVVEAGLTVIAEVDDPLLQEYEVAPAAVNVEDCPAQILVDATVTTGNAVTETVATTLEAHPLEVPVTV